MKPVQRRNGKSIPDDIVCPLCGVSHHFIYDNNGGNGQYQCKVCGQTFCSGEVVTTPFRLTCPHCSNTLVDLKKVEQKDLEEDYGKNKYRLHYINREFTVDFFAMDLNSLPKDLEHADQEFYSGDASRHNRRHQGLGMAIARKLLEEQEGRLEYGDHKDGGGEVKCLVKAEINYSK